MSQVYIPAVCHKHQVSIVKRLGLGPDDAWGAAIVVVNVALFQKATVDGKVWERCSKDEDGQPNEEDLSLVLAEIGCLACYQPLAFKRVIQFTKEKGLSALAQVTQSDPHTLWKDDA